MRALITGAAGQDGTILSATLSQQGAELFGLVKPGAEHDGVATLQRYAPEITLLEIDLADADALQSTVRSVDPTHVWNFGGFSAPGASWDHQEEVTQINVEAVAALLSGVREQSRQARFFQASSATIFEGVDKAPQSESTEMEPKSPYAKSKARAMEIVREARADRIFACSGIFYNHESPLRGEGFVTRKISQAVAKIAAGLQSELELGDVEVARDWGWAPDYVRATLLMLQADAPKDFVLATGISHRLSFFVQRAFLAAGISNWQDFVRSSTTDTRPMDTNLMVGDSRAAYLELGWRHSVDFDSMARIMVEHDMALLSDPHALWKI